MRTLPAIALSVLLASVATGEAFSAQQVELHLRSGQIVTGELLSEDADQLMVKATTLGKSGHPLSITMGYKRADIAEVIRVADPEQTYQTRATAAKTADEHAALATWCHEHSMLDRAIEQAEQAVALDPKQAAAGTLLTDLGLVQADGKWVKENDLLASQGKVRYQGKIMTLAEAEALKAQQHQQQGVKDAQQAVDDKAAALASLDHQIADLPKRPAQIETELAKDTAALATAQALTQRVADTKTAFDAAEKNLQQAQTAPRTAGGGYGAGNANTPDLALLRQAAETAQKAYNDARRNANGSDAEVTRLKAHIVALNEEKKNLDKKANDLRAKREAVAKELEQAKAALGSVPKPASTPGATGSP